MGRKIAISDIHGCYKEFSMLLEDINYQPRQDELILLGDYVDRGRDSKKVIEYIVRLKEIGKVTTLLGNHDKWFMDFLENKMVSDDLYHWLKYGGYDTLVSFISAEQQKLSLNFDQLREIILVEYPYVIHFLNELELYSEDEFYYYVHAGINPALYNIKSNREVDFYFMNRQLFLHSPHSLDKPVVFGHTPTLSINGKKEVYISENGDKIGIDGGCVFGNRLNALLMEDGKTEIRYVEKENTI